MVNFGIIFRLCFALQVILLVGCSKQHLASVTKLNFFSDKVKKEVVVKKGDTLTTIANRHGVSYIDIAKTNKLKPPYIIFPGQTLNIATSKDQEVLQITESHPEKSLQKSKKKTLALHSWKWPVHGRVLENFKGKKSSSQGIKIEGTVGTAVTAAASGKVVFVGDGLKMYGNLIIVKHDKNFLSVYAYNDKIIVKEGDKVKKGQIISYMGKDEKGRNILHFEIRYKGVPVDPNKYLT